MHSYIHEQAMMDITPNSSSVIIAGDKCILFLVLVVTVNLLQNGLCVANYARSVQSISPVVITSVQSSSDLTRVGS